MAKSGMKKSKVRGKSQRAIEMEQEKLAEEQAKQEKLEKAKALKKKNSSMAIRVMLGLYSLILAVISWLLDWMGVVAIVSVIMGVFGIIKLKDNKDKYYYCAIAATVLGGIRFIWEMVSLILYLIG